jgi:hypothetical protein
MDNHYEASDVMLGCGNGNMLVELFFFFLLTITFTLKTYIVALVFSLNAHGRSSITYLKFDRLTSKRKILKCNIY